MAYSYIKVSAAAGQTSVPFSFDYLNTNEIKVSVNDVEITSWSLSSPNVVALNTPLAGGEVVEIERVTNLTTRAVDFSSGAVLTEEDLDLSAQQVFNAAQEALDSTEKNLTETFNGQYDAKNKRITNLGLAQNLDDAASRRYVEEEWLTSGDKDNLNLVADNLDTISDAVDAAERAEEAAVSAGLSSVGAQQNASAAASSATNALTSENNATTSAGAAASSESTAIASATSAASSEASATNALTEFRKEWLGDYSSDPSVDGNGDPLDGGELYYNTAVNALKVYDGTAWIDTSIAFNIAGVNNVTTSVRNYEYVGDKQYPLVTDIDYRVLLGVNEGTGNVFGKSLIDKTYLGKERFYRYTDEGVGNYPVVTDAENRILLGVNGSSGKIIGSGFLGTDYLGRQSQAEYFGDGDVLPIVTDNNYRVLLGVERGTGTIVGDITQATGGGGSTSSGPVETPMEDLPASLQVPDVDINHHLFYGQSLSVGAQGRPPISVTQPYSNITFEAGPRGGYGSDVDFTSFKPLVEDGNRAPDGGTNRGETPCSGAANHAITLNIIENGAAPDDHVILSSAGGRGGYSISQLELGTAWYPNMERHIQNGYDNAVADGKTYACHMVSWLQGENDSSANNYQWYYDKFIDLQADIEDTAQTITGQTSPVFLCTYQLSYMVSSRQGVPFAQLDACRNSDKHFLATPCYHIPFHPDRVHLTPVGSKLIGHYYGRIYKQVVIDKKKPIMFDVKSATYRENKVYVKFDVPVKPLVLDYDNLAQTTDYGFKVVDDTGTLTLSDFEIINGDTVVMTVNRALAANAEVRYAIDYLGSGLIINGGASGNLRDSEPETTFISGTEYKLFNVAPHFKQDIVTLG